MSRDELIKILDFENGKPDEMGTDWAVVSRAAALRAMVAAYNRAIDDAQKLLDEDVDWRGTYDLSQLRIKGG